MLTQLSVKNLAIVAQLELNFAEGMHIITGETGAGKSIIIDALSIVLGERASAEQIRATQTQAEVTACFNLNKLPVVLELLRAQELDVEHECIIRRIINSDGRSRAYVNGHSVTAQQLKALSPHLVHIHSQHQHHALLDSDYQRQILDVYAAHESLLLDVKNTYQEWADIKAAIQALTDNQNQSDKLTLLNYQIQEFDNLDLLPNELNELDLRHKQLSKSEELLSTCQAVTDILDNENGGVLSQLHNALNQIALLQKVTPQLKPCTDLLQQAIIQASESSAELNTYLSKLDLDPAQLQIVEQRLSAIHNLARKLKVAPEFLHDHYAELKEQHDTLAHANEKLELLQQQLQSSEQRYNVAATKLTSSRISAAQNLSAEIITRLKTLEMPNAQFAISCDAHKQVVPSPHGNETINFLVTTNPGQPLGLLKKVASGGELSRISLAIQVISAQQMATPTLIMDEVDVGISGKTAATVGHLMRELAANAQILCITHLPQVAALGQWHFKVEKQQTKNATSTSITMLSPEQRVQELARLLGGLNVTAEALAHAKSMLESTV